MFLSEMILYQRKHRAENLISARFNLWLFTFFKHKHLPALKVIKADTAFLLVIGAVCFFKMYAFEVLFDVLKSLFTNLIDQFFVGVFAFFLFLIAEI